MPQVETVVTKGNAGVAFCILWAQCGGAGYSAALWQVEAPFGQQFAHFLCELAMFVSFIFSDGVLLSKRVPPSPVIEKSDVGASRSVPVDCLTRDRLLSWSVT